MTESKGAYFGFVFSGLDELQESLRSLPEHIENNIANQAYSSATRIYRKHINSRIRAQVKRKTGNLLKGVRHEQIKMRGRVGAFRVFMGPPAYHAHLIEWGTKLRPAIVGYRSRLGITTARVAKLGPDRFRVISNTGRGPKRPFFWAGIKSGTPEAMAKYKAEASRKMKAWAKQQRKKAGV